MFDSTKDGTAEQSDTIWLPSRREKLTESLWKITVELGRITTNLSWGALYKVIKISRLNLQACHKFFFPSSHIYICFNKINPNYLECKRASQFVSTVDIPNLSNGIVCTTTKLRKSSSLLWKQ